MIKIKPVTLVRGAPTEVEGSVPLTSMSRSAAFDIANNIYFSKNRLL
jgi:hypothetical protein